MDRAELGGEAELVGAREAGGAQTHELVLVERASQLGSQCPVDRLREVEAAQLDAECPRQRAQLHRLLRLRARGTSLSVAGGAAPSLDADAARRA
jgi:hypothetical protein